MPMLRPLWLLGAALSAALPACGDPAAPTAGTYIGEVGDLFVAVIAGDSKVAFYACDGREGVADPLQVRVYDEAFTGHDTLTMSKGGHMHVVDLIFSEGVFRGTLDGAIDFEAPAAGGAAGFFWGETADQDQIGGWIVTEDGDQRGAVLKRSSGDIGFFLLAEPGGEVAVFDGQTIDTREMVDPSEAFAAE